MASVRRAEEVPRGGRVAAQAAAVEALWRHLEAKYGAYTTHEVAVLCGADPKNHRIVTRLAESHRLIAYTTSGVKRYPRFEFSRGMPHPCWQEVVQPLATAGWDDDDILLWMVSRHPALSGREPAELIDTGQVGDVIRLACDDAAGVW